MYNTMASPWNSNIPPPPGTAGSYGYQQGEQSTAQQYFSVAKYG